MCVAAGGGCMQALLRGPVSRVGGGGVSGSSGERLFIYSSNIGLGGRRTADLQTQS